MRCTPMPQRTFRTLNMPFPLSTTILYLEWHWQELWHMPGWYCFIRRNWRMGVWGWTRTSGRYPWRVSSFILHFCCSWWGRRSRTCSSWHRWTRTFVRSTRSGCGTFRKTSVTQRATWDKCSAHCLCCSPTTHSRLWSSPFHQLSTTRYK